MNEGGRSVIAVTTDLFVQSRVSALASSYGFRAQFAENLEELLALMKKDPVLVVLDLSSTDQDQFTLAQAAKAHRASLRIFGIFPHVREELKAKAETAGVDVIVPNSKFLETLRTILSQEARLG